MVPARCRPGAARGAIRARLYVCPWPGRAADLKEARTWYERAAEGGDTYAMNNLGEMYANAAGVEADIVRRGAGTGAPPNRATPSP